MELGFRAFFLKKKFYLQLRLIEVYSGVFNGTQVASFFSFFKFDRSILDFLQIEFQ